MNISFAYLFKETFRAFFRNLKYSSKLIIIWLLPAVLIGSIVSKLIMDFSILHYLAMGLDLYIYYVCYFILLPLIIQRTAFDRELGIKVPLSVQFSVFIKYIKIMFYALLISLLISSPGALLVGVLSGISLLFVSDLLIMQIISICLVVVCSIFIFYVVVKLNFALVNMFDTDVPVLQILKLKLGFKNAFKIIGSNIVILFAFLIPLFLIFVLISLGSMFFERLFDSSVVGFNIHDIAYIPFFSNFFVVALYRGFITVFVMGFYSVLYKKYIKGLV